MCKRMLNEQRRRQSQRGTNGRRVIRCLQLKRFTRLYRHTSTHPFVVSRSYGRGLVAHVGMRLNDQRVSVSGIIVQLNASQPSLVTSKQHIFGLDSHCFCRLLVLFRRGLVFVVVLVICGQRRHHPAEATGTYLLTVSSLLLCYRGWIIAFGVQQTAATTIEITLTPHGQLLLLLL